MSALPTLETWGTQSIATGEAMDDRARLRLLGPVQVWDHGTWRTPARPQLRLLLAVHALSAGRVVPAGDLVDLLWDDRPPKSARASLQVLA
ncbi:MAG: AfsR/SARP family transcriptional regulator, partial [Streptosporangiaceae bacterium]